MPAAFSFAQYKRNREYRAAIGFLLLLLVFVVIWRFALVVDHCRQLAGQGTKHLTSTPLPSIRMCTAPSRSVRRTRTRTLVSRRAARHWDGHTGCLPHGNNRKERFHCRQKLRKSSEFLLP